MRRLIGGFSLGGDKAGDWKDWYDRKIPIAEQRYADWLRGFR